MMIEGLLPSGSKDSQTRAPDAVPEWGGLQQNNHNKWDEASGKPKSLSSSAVVKLHISGCDLDCCSRSKLARLKSLYSSMPHFSQKQPGSRWFTSPQLFWGLESFILITTIRVCVHTCMMLWRSEDNFHESVLSFSLAEVGSLLLLTGWLVCPQLSRQFPYLHVPFPWYKQTNPFFFKHGFKDQTQVVRFL